MAFLDQLLRLSPVQRGPVAVRLAAAMEVLQGGGGAEYATMLRQVSTAGKHLETTSAIPANGTLIAVISPTAIGSSFGGIVNITNGSTRACWLAIFPGSPDTIEANVVHPAGNTRVAAAYTSDAALYDGTLKVVWARWTASSAVEVGYGSPSDGNSTSAALTGSPLNAGAVSADVGNINDNANGCFAGDYEVAVFSRSLSDGEIDGVVSALSLASLAPGDAILYPRPAAETEPGTTLSSPSTQLQREDEGAYSLKSSAGSVDIQMVST